MNATHGPAAGGEPAGGQTSDARNGQADSTASDVLASALAYAGHGMAVFPAYTIDAGRCSCGAAGCPSPGKHPIGSLVPHGVSDATTDTQTIRQWWAVYPDANVGIATGRASGFWALDIDAGGDATIATLEARYGELPATWAVETGSGGLHLYYRMPPADVRNSAGAIGPGVDVRGSGGYVIAPPSRHRSGNRYRWGEFWRPGILELAGSPDWLLRIVTERPRVVSTGTGHASTGDPIREGVRNQTLTTLAGAMRRRGFGQTAIAAALKIENRERCRPPLDDAEIEKIAGSIALYAPGANPQGGGATLVLASGARVAIGGRHGR